MEGAFGVITSQNYYKFHLCFTRIYRLKENVIEHSFSSLPFDSDKLVCSFEIKWKVSTGKCVDASPLLVQDESHDYQETVYIGSHSGKFFAICFQTGRTLWVSQLSDRIEASACVSVCGQFVTVGELNY